MHPFFTKLLNLPEVRDINVLNFGGQLQNNKNSHEAAEDATSTTHDKKINS